jgi:hypothetical protein
MIDKRLQGWFVKRGKIGWVGSRFAHWFLIAFSCESYSFRLIDWKISISSSS